MPRIATVFAVFAAPLVAAAAIAAPVVSRAQPYPINPGYWEVTTNWLGLVKKTERWCVAPKAIPRFLAGPCNHIYHCTYPVQEFHDGHAHFEGVPIVDAEASMTAHFLTETCPAGAKQVRP
jgi:hypothetical protein